MINRTAIGNFKVSSTFIDKYPICLAYSNLFFERIFQIKPLKKNKFSKDSQASENIARENCVPLGVKYFWSGHIFIYSSNLLIPDSVWQA